MLVYYSCPINTSRNSFERQLVVELQKTNVNLWSSTIQLQMANRVISNYDDDNFGNTNVAIIVVSHSFFENDVTKSDFYKLFSYDTITLFLVLNEMTLEEVKEYLEKDDKSNFLSKIKGEYIFDSNDGLDPVASQIGIELFKLQNITSDKISTGIKELDYLLDGGLVKGSSFNIIGPRGSGKTTIGIQIQKRVLEAGGGGLYITYSLSPLAILRRFTDMGCNITKHIKEGRFRIYDSYSALNGLTREDTRTSVGDECFTAIIRVDNPYDTKSYFENQIEAIKSIAKKSNGLSVNIIDSTNERYLLKQQQQNSDPESYKQYFSKFKAKAGDVLHFIGIHLVQANDEHDELVRHLTRMEDGSIILIQEKDEKSGKVTRYLKVEEYGSIGGGDNKKYQYIVNKNGIIFLPQNT